MFSFLESSFRAVETFPLASDGKVICIGIVVPMFQEHQRLLPRTKDNPYGEDAFRSKIKQLLELSPLNRRIIWTLLAVEDGEAPGPNASATIVEALLKSTPGGLVSQGIWKSMDGRISAQVLRFPQSFKQKLQAVKGGAVVWGLKFLLQTDADLLIYTDTDLSADLRQIGLLLAPLAEGKKWVVGSRMHPGSRVTNRSTFGKLSSRLYSLVVRLWLPMKIAKDMQAGFKLFQRDVLESILPVHGKDDVSTWRLDYDFDYGLSFDSNLISRAAVAFGSSRGDEVPIAWNDSPEMSCISMLGVTTVVLRMLRSLFKQRANLRRFAISETVRRQNSRMTSHHFKEMDDYQESHWWFKGRRRVIHSVLERLRNSRSFPKTRVWKIADVGCGVGDMTSALTRWPGAEVMGIESDDHARTLAIRKFPAVRFMAGTVDALPLQTNSMDLLCYCDVLEHLPDETGALEEAWRCLHPEGFLLITVPAYQWLWSPHDESLAHYRRYSLSELQDKLTEARFHVHYRAHFVALLFPAILAARTLEIAFRWRATASSTGTDLRPPPVWINKICSALMKAEALGIKRGIRFPWGSSIVVLAQKTI